MANLRPEPRFMTSTEASRASKLTPTSSPRPISPGKDESSSMKRKNVVTSASKRFATFGRKDGHEATRPLSGLHISSPFGFQKIDSVSKSLTRPREAQSPMSALPADALRSTRDEQSQCPSPLDKPLPSLPVATVVTKSPVKCRRSLIDATEKPLRRSLSPVESEDWPTLLPLKRGAEVAVHQDPRQNTTSLGDSVIERIKKLNLNDDADTSYVADDNSSRLRLEPYLTIKRKPITECEIKEDQSDAINPIPICSAATSNPTPSSEPMIAQPESQPCQTLDLRKRISSTTLESPGLQKLRVCSSEPSPVLSGFGRSRSIKRDRDKQTTSDSTVRPRSQSRHRVTAQGSPYVVSKHVPSEHTKHRSSSEACDQAESRKVAVGKCVDDGDTSSADTIIVDAASQAETQSLGDTLSISPQYTDTAFTGMSGSTSGNPRKSSIPLPTRLIRKYPTMESEAEIPSVKSTRTAVASLELDGCDGDIDTDVDLKRRRKSSNGSRANRNSALQGIQKQPEKSKSNRRDSVRSSSKVCTLTNDDGIGFPAFKAFECKNPSTSTVTGTTHVQDEYEGYRVKHLSLTAPEYGPKLRISDSAHTFLIGDEDNEDEEDSEAVSTEHNDITRITACGGASIFETIPCTSHSDERQPPLQIASSTRTVVAQLAQTEELKQRSSADNTFSDKVADKAAAKSTRLRSAASVAPQIKPYIPRDATGRGGWPLKESTIAPFRPLGVSQARVDASKQEAATITSQQQVDASPAASAKSRYDISEALKSITPSDAESQIATWFGPTNLPSSKGFPVRSSSRTPVSNPVNGLQITSGRVSTHGVRDSAGSSTQKIPTCPPMSARQLRFTHSLPHNHHRARTGPVNKIRATRSPPPVAGAASNNKGVISNIRGLFHKRPSTLHSRPENAEQLDVTRATSVSCPKISSVASPIAQPRLRHVPRSPRVRGTTPPIWERRLARSESRPFHRGHRDVATISPPLQIMPYPELDFLDVPTSTLNGSAAHKTSEIAEATRMIHDVLEQIRDTIDDSQRLRMFTLSKIVVKILEYARKAEIAKEEANQAVARAEMECCKISSQVEDVSRIVKSLIDGNTQV